MATETRIYRVKRKTDAAARFVRASHPSHALRHVASDEFEVAVAGQEELVAAVRADVAIEDVKPEPQQQLPGTD